MGKRVVCAYCGNAANKRDNGHNYKYCSQSCYQNARFGKVVEGDIPSVRNPLCIEAIKLCQSGLNKREASDRVGIKQYILADWFHRYGAENEFAIYAGRVCGYCGKSLLGMKALSSRKYCSKSCSDKAAYRRKHPTPARMKSNPELRAKALELYSGGLEGTLIARYLGVADGTVYSWIHDFGHLCNRKRNPEVFEILPIRDRLSMAQDTLEWQKILREFASGSDSDTVILACGTLDIKGEISHLSTIVSDILKQDPCDGNIYAFCNSRGTQVSTICWMYDTFRYTKLPKAYGSYVWPDAKIGTQIEVRKNEFEYLLSLQKKRGSKPYLA